MIQPDELKLDLQVEVGKDIFSTTDKVWNVLQAGYAGNLSAIKELIADCPELIYAQYNYAPPVHFAVREGHIDLVKYLLERGAHDTSYRFYPFLDDMQTVAADRGYDEIVRLLNRYAANPSLHRFSGDNGRILYIRTSLQKEFENAVEKNDFIKTRSILEEHPEFALDPTYFWSEGILMKPAKQNQREMIELLTGYGAKAPDILKWTQFYYFERYDGAALMMEKGMNPDTMSWQRVTILHDMAQKGFLDKAALLIKYGASLDPVDDAYQSTPLGLAARWGHAEMVDYLIQQGADVNKAGASWATPLTWAMKKGFPEIAAALVKAGAK